MKKSLRITSFLLALIMLFSLSVISQAAQSKTLNMLCYNVAGLPSINGIMGIQGADVPGNQTAIGNQLGTSQYDIIAVQEDFGYHKNLVSGLGAYPYKTVHSGGIPGGDGLNVFSKYPVYNEKRTAWEKTYGIIKNGADELTPKGILYTVLDIGEGITVDFYVLHADAGGAEGSVKARNDNFRQLSEIIKARGNSRPVIVTGDFNTSSHLSTGGAFTQYLIRSAKLKDAWTELYNHGDYNDYSYFEEKYGSNTYRGSWDSIEKFLYKDGGGVHIDVESFEYIEFFNNGVSASDHKSASAVITFTKTADFVENTETLKVVKKDSFNAFLKKMKAIFTDLFKILTDYEELFNLLK